MSFADSHGLANLPIQGIAGVSVALKLTFTQLIGLNKVTQ
jgi:hypothetical protein